MPFDSEAAFLNGLSRDEHLNRTVGSIVPEVWPMLTQFVHRTIEAKVPIAGIKFGARRGDAAIVRGSAGSRPGRSNRPASARNTVEFLPAL